MKKVYRKFKKLLIEIKSNRAELSPGNNLAKFWLRFVLGKVLLDLQVLPRKAPMELSHLVTGDLQLRD